MNLGDSHALSRALKIPTEIRKSEVFHLSFKSSLAFYTTNYYEAIQIMKKLPHLVAALASLKLPLIRQNLMKTFSVAYSSKVLKVPLDWIQKILLYDTEKLLEDDLRLANVEIIYDKSEKFAIFNKSTFNDAVTYVSKISLFLYYFSPRYIYTSGFD